MRSSFDSRHRRGIAPLTSVRAYRLERGLTLADVASRAGITTFRLSIVEREPDLARPGELEAHKRAIDELHGEQTAIASDAGEVWSALRIVAGEDGVA